MSGLVVNQGHPEVVARQRQASPYNTEFKVNPNKGPLKDTRPALVFVNRDMDLSEYHRTARNSSGTLSPSNPRIPW